MINEQVRGYLARLRESGVGGEACDEWEVSDLEQRLRVSLPPSFKAFLLLAGKRFDPFVGSQYVLEQDGFYEPAELQRAGRAIARRDSHRLPADAFVFFVHQGVAVRYFELDGSDDPPVLEYEEHKWPAKVIAQTFTGFLSDEVRELSRIRSQKWS